MQNGQFTRTGGSQVADVCHPMFYEEAVQTGEEGGRKTFAMVERVRIIMPGNGLNIPVFNVTDEYRERWPREYEAFKNGLEPDLNGTPLEEWAILNKAQVLELKSMHIRTIEDVANLADTAVQRIGRGGYALRERAKAWLDEKAEQEILTRVTAENEKLSEQISIQSRHISEMQIVLESLQKQINQNADAPSAVQSAIPAQMDINQRNAPTHVEASPQGSAFDNISARKPRGRPKKVA